MYKITLFSKTFQIDKYLTFDEADYIDSNLNLMDKILFIIKGDVMLNYYKLHDNSTEQSQIWLKREKGKKWLTYPKGHYKELRRPR